MKEKIKELRVSIDGLAQLTKELKPDRDCGDNTCTTCPLINSTQINKAVDSLYLAKAWLGKVLGALGSESPYPKDGTRKTVEDIEPTAEKAIDKDWVYGSSMSHVEKVDWLRQEIESVLLDIRFKLDLELSGSVYSNTFINNITTHLSEARFWLGFELERIREKII